MKLETFLFQLLQEEAAEVIQSASKINRFGLDHVFETKKSLKEEFIIELNDFYTILNQLADNGVLSHEEIQPNEELMKIKSKKVLKYARLSQYLEKLD